MKRPRSLSPRARASGELELEATKPISDPQVVNTASKDISDPHGVNTAPKHISDPHDGGVNTAPKLSDPHGVNTAPKQILTADALKALDMKNDLGQHVRMAQKGAKSYRSTEIESAPSVDDGPMWNGEDRFYTLPLPQQ